MSTGMNRTDFKPCAKCGKGVMHTGLPLFYRVRIERMGIDLNAVRTQHGLELMLGSPAIADVFSPHNAIANPIPDSLVEVLICETCSMEDTMIAVLANPS